ncbi:MAG: hypothetical protein AAF335_03270, partial [Bacteroidota bacterium]
ISHEVQNIMKKYFPLFVLFSIPVHKIHAAETKQTRYPWVIKEAIEKINLDHFPKEPEEEKENELLENIYPNLSKIVNYHIKTMRLKDDNKKISNTKWLKEQVRIKPKNEKLKSYTNLDELKKSVAEDLLKSFQDKNGTTKNLESIFTESHESTSEGIRDKDRFLALLEVEKGINAKVSSVEAVFQNFPIEIPTKKMKHLVEENDVKIPISIVLPASILSYGAGKFGERGFGNGFPWRYFKFWTWWGSKKKARKKEEESNKTVENEEETDAETVTDNEKVELNEGQITTEKTSQDQEEIITK